MDNDTQATIPVTTIPASAQEWKSWLEGEEASTKAAYGAKPTWLIADANRERSITRDYEGREILELLQNANDQAAELGMQGIVAMQLLPDGLLVANTGLPFSREGVASLQTSHLSPKRHRREQLVGNKGLGFRAILNWTATPCITSQHLKLAVSPIYTSLRQGELARSFPEIATLLAKEQRGKDVLMLPLLRFPMQVDDRNAVFLRDGSQRMLALSAGYIDQGFQTVIGMPFDIRGAADEARKQIDFLRPEVLLFAPNLQELRLHNLEAPARVWQRAGDTTGVRIVEGIHVVGSWQIHRKKGPLPAAVRGQDGEDATGFEVTIAIPNADRPAATPLFMYFPTEVMIPLPVLCHATLELEQNRKHLAANRNCNRFVLSELATLLGEVAEMTMTQDPEQGWHGASLLLATSDYPKALADEGFPQAILEQAQKRRILPALSGKAMTSSEACFLPNCLDVDWLTPLFPDCVRVENASQAAFVATLKVRALSVQDILTKLRDATLTFDQRLSIIVGLTKLDNLKLARSSSLLLDQGGNTMEAEMRVFLPPSTHDGLAFPAWAKLRFLHEPLRERLEQALHTRDKSELQSKLKDFGVLEYAIANIAAALAVEFRRRAEEQPEKAEHFRAELLSTLFALYKRDGDARKAPVKLDRATITLRTQAGEEAPSATLYLGEGFGRTGVVMQAMLHWGPQHLVDASALPPLTDDRDELRDFLVWLGAAQWPRNVKNDRPELAYLDVITNSLRFPIVIGDLVVHMKRDLGNCRLHDIGTVEHLDRILTEADSHAIATWLAMDPRAAEWQAPGSHATLEIQPSSRHNARTYRGPLPSYTRWRLACTPWLQTANGKIRPQDCVLGEHQSEALFPRPIDPPAQWLAAAQVARSQVVEGWRRAGVLTSLAYLERDDLYAKLLELPQRSPDGALARPLYHWLLDADTSAGQETGPYEQAFRTQGRMWGTKANQDAYYPIADLFHADSERLPRALLERLAIVSLRKRAGNDKVEQLFGVKPIESADVKRDIVRSSPAIASKSADDAFQAAKPYLHKLRTSRTGQKTQLSELKRLTLVVCKTLDGAIEFNGERHEYAIPPWEWQLKGDVLYVQADPSDPWYISTVLLAQAIGEALATVFRLTDGGEFAQIFACPEQDRLALLRRLRPETSMDDLDAIREEYDVHPERAADEGSFPLVDPPTPSMGAKAAPEASTAGTPATAPAAEPVLAADASLAITERDHVPTDAPAERALQIRRQESASRTLTVTTRVTDGMFSERKVVEFESAEQRFPLQVGHIMGYEGPLCDILSFSSELDLERFRETRDMTLVERFIEVKGRSSPGAVIELRGNALEGARRYSGRYYLYRLFEANDGTYDLAILKDPFEPGNRSAWEIAVHVHVLRAPATLRYAITGGISAASRHQDTAPVE